MECGLTEESPQASVIKAKGQFTVERRGLSPRDRLIPVASSPQHCGGSRSIGAATPLLQVNTAQQQCGFKTMTQAATTSPSAAAGNQDADMCDVAATVLGGKYRNNNRLDTME